MTTHTFENIHVFLITEDGTFAPVSDAVSSGELDTADFADGVWGLFGDSGGMVNRLDGNMTIREEINEIPSEFTSTSLRLWRSLGGSPSNLAGTYVTVGLRYSTAHQDIDISMDTSVAGDGYVAAVAEYAELDVDREVFWAFSEFYLGGEEPAAPFWTTLVGTHQAL